MSGEYRERKDVGVIFMFILMAEDRANEWIYDEKQFAKSNIFLIIFHVMPRWSDAS